MKVEIISGDHLNKPDVGMNIARRWFDVEGVDAIADVPTSSVALAINELTRDKNKVFLAVGPATSDLTGKACVLRNLDSLCGSQIVRSSVCWEQFVPPKHTTTEW